MSKSTRLLTKSRFKVGSECTTKLYYLDNSEYGNKKKDDPFLKALAEGGFQVGELAKIYHQDGTEILQQDYDESVAATNKLLSFENATIFEAALRFENLFVRVDILKKSGDSIELIEVKAKSFDPTEEHPFFTKKGIVSAEWEPYLLDIAFQTYVAKLAYPSLKVESFLILADKSATASVDGVNQRFLITRDATGKTCVKVRSGTTRDDLGEQLLCKVNVSDSVDYIVNKQFGSFAGWQEHVNRLVKLVVTGSKARPVISSDCKKCEFRIDTRKSEGKSKSGFNECWREAGVPERDLAEPMVFDIWDFKKSQSVFDSGRYLLHQVDEVDISPEQRTDDESGLSRTQRQWIQVQKVKSLDSSTYLDVKGLAVEFKKLIYPLHFIDFETSMTAIPFNKGRRPYEQIAFQFSHHVLNRDGTIQHKNQFIHRERGTFPNFHFIRELKKSLVADKGSIFRYSNHENTVLRQIYEQILASRDSIHDADELMAWIDTVSTKKIGTNKQPGKRTMIDLLDWVKKYYYSPTMNGSNSIKQVLPAVLRDSEFLIQKYSAPLYGAKTGPTSLNFRDWAWLQRGEEGKIIDPYTLLPPIFTEEELETIEPMIDDPEIANGGSAMMAFALMQFSELTDVEASKVQDALLKYCELDTFAMVMIFEYWKDAVKNLECETST